MDPTLAGFIYGAINELDEGGSSLAYSPFKTSLMMTVSGTIYSALALGLSSFMPEKLHSVFAGILFFGAGYKIVNVIKKNKD